MTALTLLRGLWGVALLLCGASIFAQTNYTWDGGAGTSNWTDPANWNPDGLPTGSDDVRLSGAQVQVVVPAGDTAHARFIDICCEADLTVASGAVLKLTEGSPDGRIAIGGDNATLTNDGKIFIEKGPVFGIKVILGPSVINNGYLSIVNTGGQGGIEVNGGTCYFENNGSMLIDSTSGTADGLHLISGTFLNTGTLEIKNTGGDAISGGGLFTNQGTLRLTLAQDDLTEGEEGLTFINDSSALYIGDGTIHHVPFQNQGGTLDPGPNPATLTFLGDEDLSSGALHFDLAGLSGAGQAGGHDQIALHGSATLGAPITVRLLEGFVPSPGDSFILMTYTSWTGNAPSFNLPQLPGTMSWVTQVTATETYVKAGGSLPVTWRSFEVWKDQKFIHLQWEVDSELLNKGFEVQRSLDGENWEVLGFVPGRGTVATPATYSFRDEAPAQGWNYYRLRQLDEDGRFSYSQVRSIEFLPEKEERRLRLHPNPTKGKVRLELTPPPPTPYRFRVLDALGRVWREGRGEAWPLVLNLEFAPAGVYFVQVLIGGRSWVGRLLRN